MRNNNYKNIVIFLIALDSEISQISLKKYSANIWILGVGKVNAAMNLIKYLTTNLILKKYKKVFMINIGIAGTIKKKLDCNCYVCDKCYFGDVDLTAFGYIYGQMAGGHSKRFYQSDSLLNSHIYKCLDYLKINYQQASIATTDKFITKSKDIKKILKVDKNICLVDMEIASIAHVCENFNISFAAIKFISDSIYQKNNFLVYKKYCHDNKINMEQIIKYLLKQLQF